MKAAEFALIDVASKNNINLEDLKTSVKLKTEELSTETKLPILQPKDILWSSQRPLSRREANRRYNSKQTKRELTPIGEIETILNKRNIYGGV